MAKFSYVPLTYLTCFIFWSGLLLMTSLSSADSYWKIQYLLIELLGFTFVLIKWTSDAERR